MSAPLEYIIIGFPENSFSGEIAPELARLAEDGVIHIVDLVFIARGADGSTVVLEVDEDNGLSAFAALDGEVGGAISDEDIEHATQAIADGSSALLIVWEDLWADPLAQAVRRAGGEFVEGARIPAHIAEEIRPLLTAAD